MITSLQFGGKMLIDSNDLSILPDILVSGYIEPGLTKYLIDNIKLYSIFVDVGANFGYFTILASMLIHQKKIYILLKLTHI